MGPTAPIKMLALFAGFIVLCGFPRAKGRVLVIPSTRHDSRSSADNHGDLDQIVSRAPDRRSHDLLKFHGCWKATVTRRELTAFDDANQGTGKWVDQGYTICFARDLSGELEPTISQTQAGATYIEDKGSDTELVGYDDLAVSLVNRHRFVDSSAMRTAPPVSWFSLKAAPKPVEVLQITRVTCLRQSSDLICAATAAAQCGEANCYSFSWKTTFNQF